MRNICLLFCLSLLLFSCDKREKFPVEPFIEFVSLEKVNDGTGIDHRAHLVLHFQDGDGDIGLNEQDIDPPFDTSSVYYYNFFIDYYKKENGEFRKLEFNGLTFNQRIPRLSNTVPESIEGEIHIDLDINSFDYSSLYDTLMMKCYIVDRALHVSNTVETTPIVVKKY
ncbi:MAG: hypothetical protein J5642_06745 [Bacteroidales bacterium]|nr:hypothetical protein [Bacteroidales bacterium]